MNDNPKPISAFDEICELTIKTMHRLDMETLLQLQKQAVHELDRAKLTKGQRLHRYRLIIEAQRARGRKARNQ